jgi:tetratricopeptide (TPR) repeat protein
VDIDHNLLFGVLALQLDLIDRDGFVNACLAWARHKNTPLADVLITRGLLTAAARAKVEQQLNEHAGDARAGLAEAADTVLRGAAATAGDADPAGSQAATVAQGAAPSADAPARTGRTRYTMLRLAGTGGIGRVWLVRDASLGREVALKELRPDRADASVWPRFVREAQVTGQLQHPGIVPVYDMGREPPDDQPFYTMRFIHGRTLNDAITTYHERRTRGAAGPLELRELLGAFVQVCQAVGYAHSRGVLHRDLKPHNVALGDFGEVMVLDWGLAKVMSEPQASASAGPASGPSTVPPGVTPAVAHEPTLAGNVLGTPAYMAPEQADGQHDLMDARTDVYGLGAILYQVLTGTAPFTGKDSARVLERVRHDLPRRPRAVVRETAPALEAVCLKALAKRREDRCPSAQALAQEVQRFLADAPVTAYRDPMTVRLMRWGRRHRTAVTAGAALLLTAVVALAVGLVAVNKEKNRTARAEQQAREALAAETAALERSRQAEQSAGEQRQLALKTVRGVVTDIEVRLKDRPAQQELRKALLGRALAGLTEVARAADTATAIDHATVWVHFELGDVLLEIPDGGSAEAKRQYEKAHDLARQIAEANPEVAEAQRDLSVSDNRLGDLYLRLGDGKAARECYQHALDAMGRLADADGTTAQAQRDLSVSHNKLGDLSLELGDGKAARDSYQKALDLRVRLADADGSNAVARRDLAISHSKLGDAHLMLGDGKAAHDSYRSSHVIMKQLAEADRTSTQAQRDLSIADLKLGDAQLRLGDARAARGSYQKALDAAQRLADADTTSALARRDLSVVHIHRGDMFLGLGNHKAARDDYTRAQELRERLAEADRTSTQAQRDLSVSYCKLGTVAQESNDFQEAIGWYNRALDIARRSPEPEFFRREVVDAKGRLRFCRAVGQAVADPTTALQLPDDLRRPVLVAAISALATKEKQPAKAVMAADLLADNARGAGDLYNAGCGYALCVPLADTPQTQDCYAVGAIELLSQAIRGGFKDVAQLKMDGDLDALRSRDDFKKLVADLEAATKPKDKNAP